MTQSIMTDLAQQICIELITEMENLSIHHASADGVWLRPEASRGLWRKIYYLLSELLEQSGDSNATK